MCSFNISVSLHIIYVFCSLWKWLEKHLWGWVSPSPLWANATPLPPPLPSLPTQSTVKWSKISEIRNFLLDPISIMFHTKPHPAYSNGIGFHVQSSIHASGCAFASPKVSLEVTLPLHQGSAWDVGSSTSPCQGLQYWSLQILLQIDFKPILSLKTHSHNTGWSYEKSEEEEEARTIVCRPADFIWSCVSFAAGNKSVRHSAQKNTASNSVGMLNIMTVPNDEMNWDNQFPYKLARRQ